MNELTFLNGAQIRHANLPYNLLFQPLNYRTVLTDIIGMCSLLMTIINNEGTQ